MKVSELEGSELDAWVAKALGYHQVSEFLWKDRHGNSIVDGNPFEPSTQWDIGGPLIEKYKISLVFFMTEWEAYIGELGPSRLNNDEPDGVGDKPLVAACRAIVASVYGEEVG